MSRRQCPSLNTQCALQQRLGIGQLSFQQIELSQSRSKDRRSDVLLSQSLQTAFECPVEHCLRLFEPSTVGKKPAQISEEGQSDIGLDIGKTLDDRYRIAVRAFRRGGFAKKFVNAAEFVFEVRASKIPIRRQLGQRGFQIALRFMVPALLPLGSSIPA
jgi:hypothetical protein